jgi:hypothetical protein
MPIMPEGLTEARQITPYKWVHPDEERGERRGQQRGAASGGLQRRSLQARFDHLVNLARGIRHSHSGLDVPE